MSTYQNPVISGLQGEVGNLYNIALFVFALQGFAMPQLSWNRTEVGNIWDLVLGDMYTVCTHEILYVYMAYCTHNILWDLHCFSLKRL